MRGAIDLVLVVDRSGPAARSTTRRATRTLSSTGCSLALSGRIHLDEAAEATPEDVLRSIWESYFVLDPARAEPG